MKKKELRRQIRAQQVQLDALAQARWYGLPEREREAIVGRWITARATRRAALGPFPRAFEDEVNNAGVDIVRDYNRQVY